MEYAITMSNINKTFGAKTAIKDVSIDIKKVNYLDFLVHREQVKPRPSK